MSQDKAIARVYAKLFASDNPPNLRIPHSSVYYVRWKMWEDTGIWYSIEHVEVSMFLEGAISPHSLTLIPDWYVGKYMGGKEPNVKAMRPKLKKKWLKRKERELGEKQAKS